MKTILSLVLFTLVLVGCKDERTKSKEEVYEKAVKAVREKLKIPATAHFAALDLSKSDSVRFEELGQDSIYIKGYYHAQNVFGVYLPGVYSALFIRKDGQWVEDPDLTSVE
jgi:hypothetical protein